MNLAKKADEELEESPSAQTQVSSRQELLVVITKRGSRCKINPRSLRCIGKHNSDYLVSRLHKPNTLSQSAYPSFFQPKPCLDRISDIRVKKGSRVREKKMRQALCTLREGKNRKTLFIFSISDVIAAWKGLKTSCLSDLMRKKKCRDEKSSRLSFSIAFESLSRNRQAIIRSSYYSGGETFLGSQGSISSFLPIIVVPRVVKHISSCSGPVSGRSISLTHPTPVFIMIKRRTSLAFPGMLNRLSNPAV